MSEPYSQLKSRIFNNESPHNGIIEHTWELPTSLDIFLENYVRAGLNMLVVGEAGVGKTSLVTAISHYSEFQGQRIITVERTPMYAFPVEHIISLVSEHFPSAEQILHLWPDWVFTDNIQIGDLPGIISLGMSVPLCATYRAANSTTAAQMLIRDLMTQLPPISADYAAELLARAFPLVVSLRSDDYAISEIVELGPTANEQHVLFADGKPTGTIPTFIKRLQRWELTILDYERSIDNIWPNY